MEARKLLKELLIFLVNFQLDILAYESNAKFVNECITSKSNLSHYLDITEKVDNNKCALLFTGIFSQS